MTGETKRVSFDATDVVENVLIPGVLDGLPKVVEPPAGQSLWIVAARKAL